MLSQGLSSKMADRELMLIDEVFQDLFDMTKEEYKTVRKFEKRRMLRALRDQKGIDLVHVP